MPTELAAPKRTRHPVLLACEDAGEFQKLWDHYVATYHPRGFTQNLFVEDMAATEWRLRRARKIEASLWDAAMPMRTMTLDEAMRLLKENDRALGAISSYQTGLERSLKHIRKALLDAQKDRASAANAQRLN